MYIRNPKTFSKIFLDNRYSKYEDRLEQVERWFFSNDDLVEYCYNNNSIKSNGQMRSYYQMEQMLENVATYLLLGQYEKNNIMTIYKIRQASTYELPCSDSLGHQQSTISDLLYSSRGDTMEGKMVVVVQDPTEITDDKLNKVKKNEIDMSVGQIKKKKEKQRKSSLKFKKSRSYRINKLYSTPELKTYSIVQQFYKNRDGKRFPVKNVFGQPVFDTEDKTIGGNVGLIDENNRYKAKWCIVDTHNMFCFDGLTYKISNKIKQYRVGDDNQCEMCKILVLPKDGKLNFFDENIKKMLDLWVKVV